MAKGSGNLRRQKGFHWRAKLTDSEVELIRDMYEDGLWSYAGLAGVFGVSRYTIRDIVTYRRR